MIEIEKIIKIESINNNNINYDIEFVKSGKLYEKYYTEKEYINKVKIIEIDSKGFLPTKGNKRKFFLKQKWDLIIIHSGRNTYYFIEKNIVNEIVRSLEGSITMKSMVEKLKSINIENFTDSNLRKIIPVKYVKGDFKFYDKKIFNGFYEGVNSKSLKVSRNEIFPLEHKKYLEKVDLTKEYLKANYYDLKEIMMKFKLKYPSFLINDNLDELDISYIKTKCTVFFRKSEIDYIYKVYVDSIPFMEAMSKLNEIDNSITIDTFERVLEKRKYKISFFNACKFIRKGDYEIIRTNLLYLKKEYSKILPEKKFLLVELLRKHKKDIFEKNQKQIQLNIDKYKKETGYLTLKEGKAYLEDKLKLEIDIKNFRKKVKTLSNENKIDIKINGESINIKYKYIESQKKLFLNSICVDELKKFDNNRDFNVVLKRKRIKTYKIELINARKRYMAKSDYKRIANARLEIENGQSINIKEFTKKINDIFLGVIYCKKSIPQVLIDIIKIKNLKVYTKEDLGVFEKKNFYPKKTVDYILKEMRKIAYESKIINLYNLNHKEYELLTEKSLSELYYTEKEFKDILDSTNFDYRKKCLSSIYEKKKILERSNIKLIQINSLSSKSFFSKKETDESIEKLRKVIQVEDIEKEYGIELPRWFRGQMRINNLPLVNKAKTYVNRSEVEKIINDLKFKEYSKECSNISEMVKLKINLYRNINEKNLKKTIKLFYGYVEYISNKRTVIDTYINIFGAYNLLCDNFKKDIEEMTISEIEKIFLQIKYDNKSQFLELISFNNYLFEKKKSLYFCKYYLDKEYGEVSPYEEDEYIELLANLIEIVNNKNKIKKIYRDWRKSSAILYVYLHFGIAWRKMDLLKKLPLPDISIVIGNKSGEAFIRWLEEGNQLNENQVESIISYIENVVSGLRIESGKNKENLMCVIPNQLKKDIALLLCINCANRDIAKKNKKFQYINRPFVREYLQKDKINKVFFEEFGVDLIKSLDGGFLGTRAVKSFFSLIANKSEELGVATSYYITQLLRAHKSPDEVGRYLSNTTKIYTKKDTSKSSVEIFAMGTMASVKHNLLKLVDSEYIKINRNDQVEKVLMLEMNLLEIEKIYQVLAEKTYKINDLLNNILTDKERKTKFLEKLLYGKGRDINGEYEEAKCIIKALKIEKEINYISVEENLQCPLRNRTCIGCDFLVGTRYFIYEFEKEFNKILIQIEQTKSEFMRLKNLKRLKTIYLPIIIDMQEVWGKDIVKNLLDAQKFKKVISNLKESENIE